jgi:nitroimidazol reductase NimA-like FMN-containing flavoprotein (pyridoxamine 5'-phosphate oxidase superfamily)
MSGTEHYRRLEVLDAEECRRLLGRAVIGRLAYTEGALPAIQPVHFTMQAGRILIPTRVGSKVAAASRGAVVAFEVDDFDPRTRTGWNVTVVGQAHVLSDPAEVARLEALGIRAWAPADVPCFVTVDLALVRGRRIVAGTTDDALAAVSAAAGVPE